MPRLLVFQHVAHEILGTLDPLLRDAGMRIRYANFERDPAQRPRLARYDGLVVLGGPMSANDTDRYPNLGFEVAAIREMLDRDRPVLGICLGAQLLARALGADVRPGAAKEIGWYDVAFNAAGRTDPLLRHCAPLERIFQWHGDTFDLPAGAVHLASSPGCANQAFRHGEQAYGLQFHLEVDAPMIHRWLDVPGNAAEIASLGGQVDAQAIRDETRERIGTMQRLGRRVFAEFTGLFELPSRRRALPSR